MSKEKITKLENQVKTLIRANADLSEKIEATALLAESLKEVGGETKSAKSVNEAALMCLENGDTNGAIRHLIEG